MKRNVIFISLLFITSIFLTACAKEEKKEETKETTYTNKFECERKEELTAGQVYYRTKEYSLNDEKNDTKAIEITYKRIYDFNEAGDELLSYYDVAIYNYLIGYDMNIQKKYYDDECENRYKESTESCEVTLKDNVITVTMKGTSSTYKEWATPITKDLLIKDYEESPYTCK